MPGRNATGPNGQGPMTGGGRGNCSGRGLGRGNRGQGFGFGGGGRRWQNSFNTPGGSQPSQSKDEELELRDLVAQHEEVLNAIKQRLDDLKTVSRESEDS